MHVLGKPRFVRYIPEANVGGETLAVSAFCRRFLRAGFACPRKVTMGTEFYTKTCLVWRRSSDDLLISFQSVAFVRQSVGASSEQRLRLGALSRYACFAASRSDAESARNLTSASIFPGTFLELRGHSASPACGWGG